MTTRAKYRGGGLQFYDSATSQIVRPMSPVVFHEDFLGADTLLNGTTVWAVVDVSIAGDTTPARIADQGGGVVAIKMDSNDEAEDSVIYWGDVKGIDLKAGAIFEVRVKQTVVIGSGVRCVFGLAGDHDLDKDSVTEAAWFSLTASAVLNVETDDTSNNTSAATGVTMATDTWYICRIDCTTLADVQFSVAGAGVASSTTFDMSNLSDAEAIMQPYFSLDKASGGGLGTLYIDGMTIWANRT